MEEIERLKSEAGGKRSVGSVQAKNRMEELQGQEFGQKFKEIQALKAKKEAEVALANAPKVDPFVEGTILHKKEEREREKRKRERERERELACI